MWSFVGASVGPPPAPTVSIGAGVTRLGNTNQASTTFAGMFRPTTGDALVRMLYRATQANVAPVTVTIGGLAVTLQVADDGDAAGAAGVWIGTRRSLPTGSALDVTVAAAAGTLMGKIIVRVNDIANWGGLVGGRVALARRTASTKGIATTITTTGSFRPIAAVGGAIDANCSPLSAAGWSLTDAMTVGSTAGASSAAGFFDTTGGAAGADAPFALASATPWTDWAAAELELL